MHNIIRSDVNINDGLDAAKKKLHETKRNFIIANRQALNDAYEDYDKKAVKDELHLLTPIFTKKEDCDTAHGLYGSSRPIINEHWENLKKKNGGISLVCPICGLRTCDEMDHYVPREKMPEYSVHLTNLIPLCHDCNHDKSTHWLNDKGKRLIFNAYFDKNIPSPIIACDIKISKKDKSPQVVISVSTSLDKKNDAVILSTIKKLELIKKFQSAADTMMRQEMVRLTASCQEQHRKYNITKKDFWEGKKNEIRKYLSHPIVWNFLDMLIYSEMLQSQIMEDWVLHDMN